MTSTCNICIENCTLITCSFCSFDACKKCNTRYFLESINEAHCMNCKKKFDREFLIINLSLYWYENKYKPNRKQVLFDRQKMLFPETIQFVEMFRKIPLLKNEINLSSNELYVYDNSLYELNTSIRKLKKIHGDRIEIKNLEQIKLQNLKNRNNILNNLNSLRADIRYNENCIATGIINVIENEKQKKNPFYGKCFDEKCVGLIANNGLCVTCERKTCIKCLEQCCDKHKCNSDTLETIKLIKSDSKSCPKCFTAIHRSSGCYQMWCTNCHTTFHYRTGEILNESIHNPHYVEWKRNNINSGGENLCNLDNRVYYHRYVSKNESIILTSIMRELTHFESVDLRNVENNIHKYSDEKIYRILRCQFLTSALSEDGFKTLLFKNYKQTMRWTDTRNLFQFLIDAIKSILGEYIENNNYSHLKQQVEYLYKYGNEECLRLKNTYQNKIDCNILNILYKHVVVKKGEEDSIIDRLCNSITTILNF